MLGSTRWAVMISGRGSNLGAILDLCDEEPGRFAVSLVISSDAKAIGIGRARRAGVPVVILEKKINWVHVQESLSAYRIEKIFLCGFMRIVPASFCQAWKGKLLNLHPSLLPSYPGLNSLQRAHADNASLGATVHHVSAEVDMGKILAKREIWSSQGDPMLRLQQAEEKLHKAERRLVERSVLHFSIFSRGAEYVG